MAQGSPDGAALGPEDQVRDTRKAAAAVSVVDAVKKDAVGKTMDP